MTALQVSSVTVIREVFNAHPDDTRVVTLLSPT
jgi:hypothetical protein